MTDGAIATERTSPYKRLSSAQHHGRNYDEIGATRMRLCRSDEQVTLNPLNRMG